VITAPIGVEQMLKKFVAALVCIGLCSALSFGQTKETLDSLAKKADDIVIGKCVQKTPVMRQGKAFTVHNIQVSESLKGKSYRSGQTVSVVALGAVFSAPPVTNYVTNQPHMVEGEDVLLFLEKPGADLQKTKNVPDELKTFPHVVGGYAGKFSIIRDSADGMQKVVQVRCEDYRLSPDDKLLRTILAALEKGQLETTNTAQFMDFGGGVRGPESSKEIVDNAVRITESIRKSSPQQAQELLAKDKRPVPAPTLDEVKKVISRSLGEVQK